MSAQTIKPRAVFVKLRFSSNGVWLVHGKDRTVYDVDLTAALQKWHRATLDGQICRDFAFAERRPV
jgi:hypothetical protein